VIRTDNYTRSNVYRDRKSIAIFLEKYFEETKDIVGAEAFLIAVAKQEDPKGAISSDLVYLGVSNKEIFLFGTDEPILRVPFEKIKSFSFEEISDFTYYFPPQIPPKRAGLFELIWENSDGLSRTVTIMFPPPALLAFELEYPYQQVHKKLSEMNKLQPFYSIEKSAELPYLCDYLLKVGIPNEVNTEPCEVNEYLGYK
jgi:hypothetical protein